MVRACVQSALEGCHPAGCAYHVMTLDRAAMTVAASTIQKEFGLTIVEMSLILTVYFWTYALGQNRVLEVLGISQVRIWLRGRSWRRILANPRKIKGTSGLLHPPRHIRAASAKCKRGFCILGGHLPGANRAIIASAASMMLGQYALYEIWTFLYDNCTEFAKSLCSSIGIWARGTYSIATSKMSTRLAFRVCGRISDIQAGRLAHARGRRPRLSRFPALPRYACAERISCD